MDKPSRAYPKAPLTSHAQMPNYLPDPSILGQSFDQLLNQRGIRMIHKKVMPCPNVRAVDNSSHDPTCTFCETNGFIYYDEKEIWGAFGGNSLQKTFEAHGVWETGTATITFPTEYPDGEEADFNTFDKLIIPDFTIRLWELKEYEPRPGNTQKLRYPAQKVTQAVSIVNGVIKHYAQDTDFTLDADGQIVWEPGREPNFDPGSQVGEAISWSYYAVPVYVVVQTLRELRITQELANNGQKIARRLPQSVLVRRDFFPMKGETLVNP